MTPNQASNLKLAIKRLIAAEVTNSWSGTGDPDDTKDIETELETAHKQVNRLIAKYTTTEETIMTPGD